MNITKSATSNKYESRKERKERRDRAIVNDFQKFYNEQRIRFDDCLEKLAEIYFLSVRTIQDILCNQKK